MVGVGVCYTDLQEIIDALTFANVVIAAIIVVGAVVGAAIGGWLIGFYPIESSMRVFVWPTAAAPAIWKCSPPVTV